MDTLNVFEGSVRLLLVFCDCGAYVPLKAL